MTANTKNNGLRRIRAKKLMTTSKHRFAAKYPFPGRRTAAWSSAGKHLQSYYPSFPIPAYLPLLFTPFPLYCCPTGGSAVWLNSRAGMQEARPCMISAFFAKSSGERSHSCLSESRIFRMPSSHLRRLSLADKREAACSYRIFVMGNLCFAVSGYPIFSLLLLRHLTHMTKKAARCLAPGRFFRLLTR